MLKMADAEIHVIKNVDHITRLQLKIGFFNKILEYHIT